jgi:hypothetical protein
MSSKLRTASWVVLTIVGALSLLASLGSAWIAYSGGRDEFGIGGPTVADVEAWRPEVALAVRARRGTAAAYASAFLVLYLSVVLGPYRRGETWAWWAVLASTLTLVALTALRVPLLGTTLGVAAALWQLGLVVVGLLLDVRRLRS